MDEKSILVTLYVQKISMRYVKVKSCVSRNNGSIRCNLAYSLPRTVYLSEEAMYLKSYEWYLARRKKDTSAGILHLKIYFRYNR